MGADPFICSICKSGSARIHGERVSVRWLEAFAHFSGVSHPVRFASGLFTALTGARNEMPIPSTAMNSLDDEQEADFMDFVEDGGIDGFFLCGNNRKFILMNVLFIFGFMMSDVILCEVYPGQFSYIVMGSFVITAVYIIVVISYIFLRYQRIVNQQRIIGS
jgi:hypothetical protein